MNLAYANVIIVQKFCKHTIVTAEMKYKTTTTL